MPLGEISANSVGRTGGAGLARATSRRDAGHPCLAGGEQENQNVPSGLQSMLKTSTETGDIGIFSIRPNLRRPGSALRLSPKKFENLSRAIPAASVSPTHKYHEDALESSRYPQYRNTTASSVISMYRSDSQKPSRASSREVDDREIRSFSLTQSSRTSYTLTNHRSYASLQGQMESQMSGRPRSPFAYPTRLKRPGYRPSSPALSEFIGTNQRTKVGLDRGLNRRTSSPSSLYAQKRIPTGPYGQLGGFNRSDPGLLNLGPLPASDRHLHRRLIAGRMPTPINVLSSGRTASFRSFTSDITGTLGEDDEGSAVAPPSAMYYDYTEAFEQDCFYSASSSVASLPFVSVQRTIPEDRPISNRSSTEEIVHPLFQPTETTTNRLYFNATTYPVQISTSEISAEVHDYTYSKPIGSPQYKRAASSLEPSSTQYPENDLNIPGKRKLLEQGHSQGYRTNLNAQQPASSLRRFNSVSNGSWVNVSDHMGLETREISSLSHTNTNFLSMQSSQQLDGLRSSASFISFPPPPKASHSLSRLRSAPAFGTAYAGNIITMPTGKAKEVQLNVPSSKTSHPSLLAGSPNNENDLQREPSTPHKLQSPAILSPTPERVASSREQRNRFNKLLTLADPPNSSLESLSNLLVSFDSTETSLTPDNLPSGQEYKAPIPFNQNRLYPPSEPRSGSRSARRPGSPTKPSLYRQVSDNYPDTVQSTRSYRRSMNLEHALADTTNAMHDFGFTRSTSRQSRTRTEVSNFSDTPLPLEDDFVGGSNYKKVSSKAAGKSTPSKLSKRAVPDNEMVTVFGDISAVDGVPHVHTVSNNRTGSRNLHRINDQIGDASVIFPNLNSIQPDSLPCLATTSEEGAVALTSTRKDIPASINVINGVPLVFKKLKLPLLNKDLPPLPQRGSMQSFPPPQTVTQEDLPCHFAPLVPPKEATFGRDSTAMGAPFAELYGSLPGLKQNMGQRAAIRPSTSQTTRSQDLEFYSGNHGPSTAGPPIREEAPPTGKFLQFSRLKLRVTKSSTTEQVKVASRLPHLSLRKSGSSPVINSNDTVFSLGPSFGRRLRYGLRLDRTRTDPFVESALHNSESHAMPSSYLLAPPPPLSPLEVRSFFSDDSSNMRKQSLVRKRFSHFKAKLPASWNSADDVRPHTARSSQTGIKDVDNRNKMKSMDQSRDVEATVITSNARDRARSIGGRFKCWMQRSRLYVGRNSRRTKETDDVKIVRRNLGISNATTDHAGAC